MIPNRLKHLMRLASGALLLLLLQCAFMPSRAEAGCNHLVTSVSDRGTDGHGLDSLITGSESSLPGDTLPMPARGSTCANGQCSSRDSLPVPAPLMPDHNRSEQWGTVTPLNRLPATARDALHIEDATLRPISLASAIFHPPQV